MNISEYVIYDLIYEYIKVSEMKNLKGFQEKLSKDTQEQKWNVSINRKIVCSLFEDGWNRNYNNKNN